ncbi:MAG: DUF3768 domain-containing protein [Ancalomicrobiaceae bacterium]|nr:DUF3768 domain-containing protein [Ancalomicrobiaceae bacterium]
MPKPRPDSGCPDKEHSTNTRAVSSEVEAPAATRCGPTAERLRALNDRLRRDGIGGRVMVTRGIACLGPQRQHTIVDAVRRFDDFGPRNDPYGEHDCAVVEVDGLSVRGEIHQIQRGAPEGQRAWNLSIETLCSAVATLPILDRERASPLRR